jgi:hypothetical protein
MFMGYCIDNIVDRVFVNSQSETTQAESKHSNLEKTERTENETH